MTRRRRKAVSARRDEAVERHLTRMSLARQRKEDERQDKLDIELGNWLGIRRPSMSKNPSVVVSRRRISRVKRKKSVGSKSRIARLASSSRNSLLKILGRSSSVIPTLKTSLISILKGSEVHSRQTEGRSRKNSSSAAPSRKYVKINKDLFKFFPSSRPLPQPVPDDEEEEYLLRNLNSLNLPSEILCRLYKEGLMYHYHYLDGKTGPHPLPDQPLSSSAKCFNCPAITEQRIDAILRYLEEWDSEEDKSDDSSFNEVVPRHRRWLESDENYHSKLVAANLRRLIQESRIREPPRLKTPEEIQSYLVDVDFIGWNLQWEERLMISHIIGNITREELRHTYEAVIPPGMSSCLPALLSLDHIYIRLRMIEDPSNLNARGKTVFEVTNIDRTTIFRLFEASKTQTLCKRRKSFTGRDVDGKEVLKVIWTTTHLSSTRRVRVFCPPGVYIGSVEEVFSPFRPKYYICDDGNYIQTVVAMRERQIPFLGPESWIVQKTVAYTVDTLNGRPPGLIRGDWEGWEEEPDFGIYFPKQIGLLSKLMLMVASCLIFDRFFTRKLEGEEIYYYMNDPKKLKKS